MGFFNKAMRLLAGVLTFGVSEIGLRLGENIGKAVNDMDQKRTQETEDFKNALSDLGRSNDGTKEVIDSYNATSENPYLSYRNNPELPDFSGNSDDPFTSWLYSKTGAGLTENEKLKMMYQTWERMSAESYNHNEAVDARMYEQYMAQNKYQFETQSMVDAGINPAMVYGGGSLVPTAATGAAGSVSGQSAPSSPTTGNLSGLVDLLSTVIRLPLEMKKLNAAIELDKANAIKSQKEGDAALMNAGSNERNAGSQERQAAVAERQAAVSEEAVKIQKSLAESNIKVNDETARKLAEDTLYVKAQREQLPEMLAIAQKNADSAQKQAIAAMRQADAAVQNAATNDYLAGYSSDYMYAQRLGQDIMNGKSQLELKYLPDKLQAEIKEFQARGFFFDEQGKLAHKNQALVTAEVVRTYTATATDAARAACQVAGTVMTGGLGGTTVSLSNAMGGTTTSSATSSGFNPFITTGLY